MSLYKSALSPFSFCLIMLLCQVQAWSQIQPDQGNSVQSTSVQWASEVVRFSSQFSRKESSAQQVLGPPRMLPATGASDVAWAPARENSPVDEFIRVRFDQPRQIEQVLVGESLNPGAIYRIVLYDTQGKKHTVFEDKSESYSFQPRGRLFSHVIPRTPYRVAELKLVLRTSRVPGMSQIDAIGISDSPFPPELQVEEVEQDLFPAAPESLGDAVNSNVPDMLPMISPDGRSLYFARKYHPENVIQQLPNGSVRPSDDIWQSRLQADGTWTRATRLGSNLNNDRHNFVSWISPDGHELLLPHDYDQVEMGSDFRVSVARKLREPQGDPISGYQEWGRPSTLKVRDLYNRSEFTCIHMDSRRNVLLMALERDEGLGGLDLYVSFREEGPGQGFLGRFQQGERWSAPQSLGSAINSAGMEGSVFLAADGKTIYFSSNGRPGYGGFDMYVSRRLDDSWTNWSKPLNLGPAINSERDEYYYTIPAAGDYAYFSSDLGGNPDIYRIKLPRAARPEPVTLVTTRLEGDEPVIEARFRVIDFDEEEREVTTAEGSSDDGEMSFIVPRELGSGIRVEADGYFPVYRSLDQPDEEGVDYDPADEEALARARIDQVWSKRTRDSIRDAITDSLIPTLRAELESAWREELEQSRQEIPSREELEMEIRRELTRQLRADLRKQLLDSLAALPPAASGSAEIPDEEIEDRIDRLLEDDEGADGDIHRDVVEDIRLVPLEAGQIVRLENVYFAANKAFLRKESKAELQMVAGFLIEHDELLVEIGGHTNGLPGTEFCQELSDARARRVVDFLIEEGVPKRQLTAAGYGKTQPIASNESIEGRKKNQRVEIKILEVMR